MEEAPVVVTAATGALGPVVANLSTLLRRRGGEYKYKLRRGTRKDIKLIRSKLKSIHSILWVIWEREDLDAEAKELRMEAWRLADNMNDAIDDFILTMKRSNDGKRFTQDKTQPSRPFQDFKQRAVVVYERCRNKWKTETSHTTFSSLFSRKKTTVDESCPAKRRTRVVDPYVHKDISELVDMEEQRDNLIKHLVGEEESSTSPLKMTCIVGAAGMGKTTLARLVYEAIEAKFQSRAFVSIISCRTMTEVLASIYQQVQGLADSNTVVPLAGTKAATAEEHLIDDISSFLKDKRYLVIIDDIWHCGEWETIKKSLPDNNLGSRIVTTSRVHAITNMWRDDFDALIYNIDYRTSPKNMIDAGAVGEGFEYHHRIVGMCVGMPLAVACMLSALTKERERQEQEEGLCVLSTPGLQDRILEQVTRNGIQNTPGFEPLVESLELAYNDLPHHMLQTCLLYCSIYPECHDFSGDQLVRRWIAQGFVCMEEVAKDSYDEIVSRGFIGMRYVSKEYSTGDSLHPMMRNYLRCKLREHNFITCSSDIPSSPVSGRLCIDHWPASSDAVDPLSGIDDWHHIRSLVVVKDVERVPYKHLIHLRVLEVQGSEALGNQHLKDMCELHRLMHLFVSRTEITILPAEIGDLKQLKTLEVSWMKELAELPREMGNLQHLETLVICGTKLREQAWEIIGTLKKLRTLNVCCNPQLSGIPKDIGELQQLKNLYVDINPRITELPKEIGKLQHLETLDLSSTGIIELPREIGNLRQLKALDLSAVKTIAKLPRDIGKLQNLETLHLKFSNVKKIPREIGGLKKLKNLSAQIGALPFEAGKLPELEGLPKCVYRAWENSDLISSLAGEILSSQTIRGSTCGDGGLVVDTKHMHIPQWIKEHFNDISSLDIRICKLEERDLKILREMPYLWSLTLRFEAVPRQLIAISGEGFAKLEFLTLDSRVPRITFQEGAMPRLLTLRFQFQFYGGSPNTDPVGINHLVRLQRVYFKCNGWYEGDSPCISAIINTVRKEARHHPNWDIKLNFGGAYYSPGSSHGSDEASSSGEANDVEEYESPEIAESSHGSNEASSSEANEVEEIRA